MEIKFIDLVNDFYEKIKDKYEIDRESMRLALKSPFLQLREVIGDDACEEMRLKHIGTFLIHKQSVRKLLQANQLRFDSRIITEEEYEVVKNKLEKRLRESNKKQIRIIKDDFSQVFNTQQEVVDFLKSQGFPNASKNGISAALRLGTKVHTYKIEKI